jgi:hypothetical protein
VFLFPVLLFCHSCPEEEEEVEEEESSMCVSKSRRKRRRRGRKKKTTQILFSHPSFTLVVKERAKKLTGL